MQRCAAGWRLVDADRSRGATASRLREGIAKAKGGRYHSCRYPTGSAIVITILADLTRRMGLQASGQPRPLARRRQLHRLMNKNNGVYR